MLEVYLEELNKTLAEHEIPAEKIVSDIKEEISLYEEAGLNEEEIIQRLPSVDEILLKNIKVDNEHLETKNLTLHLKSCSELIIKSSSEKGITYSLDSKNDLSSYLEIDESDGLSVKEKGLILGNKQPYDIVVYCGPDIIISNLDIDVVNTDIKLSLLKIDNLKVNTINGDFDFENTDVLNAKINSVSGDLKFKEGKIEGDTQINTVSGNVDILKTSLLGSTIIKTVSGDATLFGCDYDETKIKMNTISGGLEINKKIVASLTNKIQDMIKGIF